METKLFLATSPFSNLPTALPNPIRGAGRIVPSTESWDHKACNGILRNRNKTCYTARGVHPHSETMMHFSPCFRFSPYFREIFGLFTILPFHEKFLDFLPPKFLMTFFLVIDHKFRISPLFRENHSFPPTLTNFPPPVLDKFTCFLHILLVFSPYFYRDA